MSYSELPYNGNYPPGVTDSDLHFSDESEEDDEHIPIKCCRCGRPTTWDPIYNDLCYRCIRALNE